jgi:hypothetical protein
MRKSQSFVDFDENCYLVPDWDISASKGCFRSILHAERSARQFPRRRKPCNSQNAIFRRLRRKVCYYGVQTLFPLHSTRRTYCMSISASKQSHQVAKRNLSNFDENSVISFRIELLRRLNALYTPFYTPNVLYVDISIETNPANRKTQSFKFRWKRCYYVPDWDTTAFKRSFRSIIHAERTACRFQHRNNSCKSQIAIIQISTKTLLFRSGLRCYGI